MSNPFDFDSQLDPDAASRIDPFDFRSPNGRKVTKRRNESSGLRVVCLTLGPLLIVIGLALLLYFALVYDTSVPVIDFELRRFERVHNLGLMQNRLIGIIVGIALAASGLALTLVGLMRPGQRAE